MPEGFIPKKPKVVDLEKADSVLENCQDDMIRKKIQGEVRSTKGDLLEREAYNAIKSHFKSIEEDVFVIHGLEMKT